MRWRATLVVVVTLAACALRGGGVNSDGVRIAYQQPPQPQVEHVESRTGFLWMSGHWAWFDGRWRWTPGRWERTRGGYAWTDGRWERRGHHWEWIEGQWVASIAEPDTGPGPGSGLGLGSGSAMRSTAQ
jgi:hypothetical protein